MNKSIVLDGTMANFRMSLQNIKRALKRNRPIEIYYVYQDPILAWEVTKAREQRSGRVIPKDYFVRSLFMANDNVQQFKDLFDDAVKLHVTLKDPQNNVEALFQDVQKVDDYVTIPYTENTLLRLL